LDIGTLKMTDIINIHAEKLLEIDRDICRHAVEA
jgi:hypothetical protein